MFTLKKSANGALLVPLEVSHFENRIVYLSGEITNETVLEIEKQLADLTLSGEEPVLMVISSPGGSIQSGLSLYGVIESLPFKVDTLVLDQASSMGAVLFICTTGKRYISRYARLFLHEPLVTGVKDGSLSGIQEIAGNLKQCQKTICDIMSKRTGRTEREIKRAVSGDHYYTFEEALNHGFADEIGDITLFKNYGRRS